MKKEYDKSILEFYLTEYLNWRIEEYPQIPFLEHMPYLDAYFRGVASNYEMPDHMTVAICFKGEKVSIELMSEEE